MALAQKLETRGRAAPSPNEERILNHIISTVERTRLEAEPFCHFYDTGMLPDDTYADLLANLPDPATYTPLNPRLYARKDGVSTRDMFFMTPEGIETLPERARTLWTDVAGAMTRPEFRKVVFRKLAPDLVERFGTSEAEVAEMSCNYEIVLMRDTEDYAIKPHPDGLNKIVTMQFYLPSDNSQMELGTSLYRRHKKLLGSQFEEVKRFDFRPNSAYAFAVSDSPVRQSWHGRELLSGFKGVRNTLMVLFQQNSPRGYAM